MTVDQRTEPLEQELLLEETKEGHASQLKRTRAAYRKKNCNDQAIFEYALKEDNSDKILITPHVGGATLDAHSLVFKHVAETLRDKLYE